MTDMCNCGAAFENERAERRGKCRACWATYMREWHRKNASKVNARIRADRAAHPEKYRRTYRPEKDRRQNLANGHGITVGEYNAMLAVQRGLCAICGQLEASTYRGKLRALAVDHDHVTGRIRGLLCAECNQGIGKLDDDPDLLEAAAEYLRRSRQLRAI